MFGGSVPPTFGRRQGRAGGLVGETTTVDRVYSYQSAASSVVPCVRVPLLCTRSHAHQARGTRAGPPIFVFISFHQDKTLSVRR